jgi:sialidase-1
VATQRETLLAFCEGRKNGRGDAGDIDLVLRRSSDAGKTWSKLQLVHEEGGDQAITIGNPAPIVDQKTGFIWLTLTRNNDEVLVTHSEDDGLTWSPPRKITGDVKAKNWNWYATGPGNGIQLTRGKHVGRLVIPCDHRVAGADDWKKSGHSHVIYSDDHGRTWKRGDPTPSNGMNECAVVERADGTLLLNMRSYRGRGCRAVATSADGGQTWSESTDDEALIEPVCQASMIRYSWPGEKEKSRMLFLNPASKQRNTLTIRLSEDEGRSWPVSKLLYAGSSAYSSIIALPDGQIGVLMERDDYKQISFTQFPLDWLTQ